MVNGITSRFFTCDGHSTTELGDQTKRAVLDEFGWVCVTESEDRIEFRINPLSATGQAIRAALDYLCSAGQLASRRLLVKVHDGAERGTIGVGSQAELRTWMNDAIALTSRPYYPIEHEWLPPVAISEFGDPFLLDAWNASRAAGYRFNRKIVEWVVTSERRAKLVLISGDESVQYIAHDSVTQRRWGLTSSFVGRFLVDLPVPGALKMSVQSDAGNVLKTLRPTVTFVKGLGRLGTPVKEFASDYIRLTIPLQFGKELEVAALMVLSKAA